MEDEQGTLFVLSFGTRRNEKIASYVSVKGDKAMQLLESVSLFLKQMAMKDSFSTSLGT